MTHRIDIRNEAGAVVLEVQGLLDRKALSEVRSHCSAPVLRQSPVRVVLRTGTDVDPGCLEELLGLEGVEVAAEAPYLRVWIAGRRTERRPRSTRLRHP
ncbi:MAG: hypothetical protein HY905_28320 [Deltaproteobacteria bacterium]|nr:hypothetical protein [Deltaproteobacteria bacterium]